MRSLSCLFVVALALPAAACRDQPAATAATAFTHDGGRTLSGPPEPADAPSTGAPMPHGDHQPHYGGVVYMHGVMHFEVVLDRGGRHRVYFSDAVRADLPASVASTVTLTITRPGWSPESITAAIDDQGEGWRADGAPVGPGEATARIAFVVRNATTDGPTNTMTNANGASNSAANDSKDDSYWIDVPFMPSPPSSP